MKSLGPRETTLSLPVKSGLSSFQSEARYPRFDWRGGMLYTKTGGSGCGGEVRVIERGRRVGTGGRPTRSLPHLKCTTTTTILDALVRSFHTFVLDEVDPFVIIHGGPEMCWLCFRSLKSLSSQSPLVHSARVFTILFVIRKVSNTAWKLTIACTRFRDHSTYEPRRAITKIYVKRNLLSTFELREKYSFIIWQFSI